jgi:hypothetical protein
LLPARATRHALTVLSPTESSQSIVVPFVSIMAALVESWTKTQLAIFFVILLLAVDE